MEWGNSITYLGQTALKGSQVKFGIKDTDRLERIAVLGRSDAGREQFIVNTALTDVERGAGLVLLDGTGRLSELFIERLPDSARERLVYLDPSDAEYPFSWNPISDYRRLPRDSGIALLTDLVASIYRTPKTPLIEWAAEEMFEREDTTLLFLYEIVAEAPMREKAFLNAPGPRAEFETLLKGESDTEDAVRRNGRYVAKDTLVRNLVGQTTSKFSVADVAHGLIVIVDLSRIRMFPTRISPIARLFAYAIRAAGVESGVPHPLYLHECLRAFSERDIELFFSERNAMTLLSDSAHSDADYALRKMALTRTGTIVSFASGPNDTEQSADLFFPYLSGEDLEKMEGKEYAIMLTIDSVRSRPFFAAPLPLPGRASISYQDVQVFSRNRYASARRDIDRAFERKYAPPPNTSGNVAPGSFSNAFRSIFAKNAAGAPAPRPDATPSTPPVQSSADSNKKPAEVSEEELKKMLHVEPIENIS